MAAENCPDCAERETLKERIAVIGAFWDWFDRRDIDKHIVSIIILSMTWKLVAWFMHYAELNTGKSGVEVAAVLGAIGVPYMALQAAAINFYFKSRPTTTE